MRRRVSTVLAPVRVPLSLLALLVACAVTDSIPADPADERFLGSGGKADDDAIEEGGLDARGVLRLVNLADRARLEAGVEIAAVAAEGITAHRVGPDGWPGTRDDDRFDTLAELDAIPHVGTATFERLLAYARARGYVDRELLPLCVEHERRPELGELIATMEWPGEHEQWPGRATYERTLRIDADGLAVVQLRFQVVRFQNRRDPMLAGIAADGRVVWRRLGRYDGPLTSDSFLMLTWTPSFGEGAYTGGVEAVTYDGGETLWRDACGISAPSGRPPQLHYLADGALAYPYPRPGTSQVCLLDRDGTRLAAQERAAPKFEPGDCQPDDGGASDDRIRPYCVTSADAARASAAVAAVDPEAWLGPTSAGVRTTLTRVVRGGDRPVVEVRNDRIGWPYPVMQVAGFGVDGALAWLVRGEYAGPLDADHLVASLEGIHTPNHYRNGTLGTIAYDDGEALPWWGAQTDGWPAPLLLYPSNGRIVHVHRDGSSTVATDYYDLAGQRVPPWEDRFRGACRPD